MEDHMLERQSEKAKNSWQHLFKLSNKNENPLLKIFLLWHSHQFLCTCYKEKFPTDNHSHTTSVMELYMMDSKIFRVLIEEIIETGEYTLEGIAYYARMPSDLFIDIMCGKNIS